MDAAIEAMEREEEGELRKGTVLMSPHSGEDTKANAQHVQRLHR
jgi:hypothetical protein